MSIGAQFDPLHIGLHRPLAGLFPNKAQNSVLSRRNDSKVRAANVRALGVRAWGDITMTDMAGWQEPTDQVLEAGVIEFYGRTVLCLVRKLSETGAALDMVRPCVVPDRFTLAFPLEGTSRPCRLVWQREAEMAVAFQ